MTDKSKDIDDVLEPDQAAPSPLDGYERSLFGGHVSGELFWGAFEGDDSVPQMYLMDAEYDPFHVVFCYDYCEIRPGENKYLALTSEQLELIGATQILMQAALELAFEDEEDDEESEQ